MVLNLGRVEKVKQAFEDINSKNSVGRTHLMQFNIDTGNTKPVRIRQYPLSPAMMQILNKELDEMLEPGVLEPSKSACSSPVLLVKKESRDYRLCFDGKQLNKVTKMLKATRRLQFLYQGEVHTNLLSFLLG